MAKKKELTADEIRQKITEKKKEAPEGFKKAPEYIETKNRRVQALIQPSVYEAVKAKASSLGISTNEAINEALRAYSELQDQLKLIENKKPDFENIQAGDHFNYCGLEWVCLDPDFEGGVLSIVAKAWKDEVKFSEKNDNNYRTSDIRKILLKELAPKLEGCVVNYFPDLTEENGKSFEDVHYEDPVFLLSLCEYIRYSKFIPYDNYGDYWWLRTPRLRSAHRGDSYTAWIVLTSGAVSTSTAITALACAPACIFIR